MVRQGQGEALDPGGVLAGDPQKPPHQVLQMTVFDAEHLPAALQAGCGVIVVPAIPLQKQRRAVGQLVQPLDERQAVHILQLAAQYQHSEAPRFPQPNTNCEYLTLALQIACSADGKLALRKEILRGVADEYHITVAAVDSGLRRMIDGLETRAPSGWERYKAENSLTGMKITTGKLIYSLQRTVLRQGIVKREHL